jgi:hypothetical protein
MEYPYPIRCAKEDCEGIPNVVVVSESTGMELAFACQLPHLAAFMWATGHLGEDRHIMYRKCDNCASCQEENIEEGVNHGYKKLPIS